jgi:hypothetical protein
MVQHALFAQYTEHGFCGEGAARTIQFPVFAKVLAQYRIGGALKAQHRAQQLHGVFECQG